MFPLRPTTPTAPELSGHLNCLIIDFNYLNQKEITVLRNICGRPYRDVSFRFALLGGNLQPSFIQRFW